MTVSVTSVATISSSDRIFPAEILGFKHGSLKDPVGTSPKESVGAHDQMTVSQHSKWHPSPPLSSLTFPLQSVL
jgi:hypothetical protein